MRSMHALSWAVLLAMPAAAPAGSIVQVRVHAGVHAHEIQSGAAEYASDSGGAYASATAFASGTGTVEVISTLSVVSNDGQTVVMAFDQQRNIGAGARPSAVFYPAGTTNALHVAVSAAKDFTLTTTWSASCSGYMFAMPSFSLYNGNTYMASLFDPWVDQPNPSGMRSDLVAGQAGEQTFRIPMTGNSFASVPVTSQRNDRVTGTITLHFAFAPKDSQTITFPPIPDQSVTGRVSLAATASSGLPVSFTSTPDSPVNWLDPTNISFTGTGVVRIVASQPGDAEWNPAPDVTNVFNVTAPSPLPPPAPTGVSATDGAYTGKVDVSWNASAGAESYQVWRNTADDAASAVLLGAVAGCPSPDGQAVSDGETGPASVGAPAASAAGSDSFGASSIADGPSLVYRDFEVLPNTTYYYWVKAVNSAGSSAFSAGDIGYPGVVGPLVIVNGMVGDNAAAAYGVPLTISLAMMNVDAWVGYDVDWWVAALAQNSGSWMYLNSAFNWVGFDGQLQNIRPVHQGPLANIAQMPIAQGLVLEPGVYNIWFAVDYPMDGVLDFNGTLLLSGTTLTVE